MIVIDSYALAKYILKEPNWRSIEKYLVNVKSVDVIVLEVVKCILKAYNEQIINYEDARKKLKALMKLIESNIILEESKDIMEAAFEIAVEEGISLTDSLYITLAIRENDVLVTSNEQIKQIGEHHMLRVIFID